MMNLEMVRARCEDFVNQAIEEGDEARAEMLLGLRDHLAEADCLSNRKLTKIWSDIVSGLRFSFEEIREFRTYVQNCTKVQGVLCIVGSDGQERYVEAILDPKREEYYRFENGPICKIRYWLDTCDTYALIDGRWVYDGSLQRLFSDVGYDYVGLSYKVLDL